MINTESWHYVGFEAAKYHLRVEIRWIKKSSVKIKNIFK